MNKPLVSVVMPVHNGEQFLKSSIESVLHQTFSDFEFIIINDGSLDRTEEIIMSYLDPRIIYKKNSAKMGLVKSLNLGIRLAKGSFIARMDADDISHKDRLLIQYRYMTRNPDVDICGSWVKLFGFKSGFKVYPLDHESIKAKMLFACPIAHPTIFCKSSFFCSVEYSEKSFPVEDYQLWADAIDIKKFSNLPVFLLSYRIHKYQISERYAALQLEESLKLQNRLLQSIGLELSGNGYSLHSSIQEKKNNVDFEDALLWIERIFLHNNIEGYFSKATLAEITADQLCKIIKNNSLILRQYPLICSRLFLKKIKLYIKYVVRWGIFRFRH